MHIRIGESFEGMLRFIEALIKSLHQRRFMNWCGDLLGSNRSKQVSSKHIVASGNTVQISVHFYCLCDVQWCNFISIGVEVEWHSEMFDIDMNSRQGVSSYEMWEVVFLFLCLFLFFEMARVPLFRIFFFFTALSFFNVASHKLYFCPSYLSLTLWYWC